MTVPDPETIARRFPRLIRALRWTGCLTTQEAVGAIRAHMRGDRWSGEAVNHYGGVPVLLARATRAEVRSLVRRYRRA